MTVRDGLSQRERALVGVMLVLVLLIGGWYGLVRPLARLEDAARARLAQASREHGRVAARVALLKARPGVSLRDHEPLPAASDVPAWLGQTAVEAGFALDQQQAGTGGRVTISAGNVATSSAFAWIERLERAGIRIESWQLRPDADGHLTLTATISERP